MSEHGTKQADVLELYAQEIARAQDAGHCLDDSTTVGEAKYMAIRDLAAALRVERERVAELEGVADAVVAFRVTERAVRAECTPDASAAAWDAYWKLVDVAELLEAARKEEP
jgi:hypothetical protein